MAINLPVPQDVQHNLYQLLSEILRRSVDTTTTGVGNGRSITGADFKVMNAGKGLVMISRGGTAYGRIILENPDINGNMVLSVDPIPDPVGINAGDIQVLNTGGGFVVPSRDGSIFGRIILENADAYGNIAISADPGITFSSLNDIAVLTAGFGMVLPCRNGLKYGRLLLENPDIYGNLTIGVDPL